MAYCWSKEENVARMVLKKVLDGWAFALLKILSCELRCLCKQGPPWPVVPEEDDDDEGIEK